MKKTNDADMLAAIVRASNRYAMRPALVIDDRTYTYQELFGLAAMRTVAAAMISR